MPVLHEETVWVLWSISASSTSFCLGKCSVEWHWLVRFQFYNREQPQHTTNASTWTVQLWSIILQTYCQSVMPHFINLFFDADIFPFSLCIVYLAFKVEEYNVSIDQFVYVLTPEMREQVAELVLGSEVSKYFHTSLIYLFLYSCCKWYISVIIIQIFFVVVVTTEEVEVSSHNSLPIQALRRLCHWFTGIDDI